MRIIEFPVHVPGACFLPSPEPRTPAGQNKTYKLSVYACLRVNPTPPQPSNPIRPMPCHAIQSIHASSQASSQPTRSIQWPVSLGSCSCSTKSRSAKWRPKSIIASSQRPARPAKLTMMCTKYEQERSTNERVLFYGKHRTRVSLDPQVRCFSVSRLEMHYSRPSKYRLDPLRMHHEVGLLSPQSRLIFRDSSKEGCKSGDAPFGSTDSSQFMGIFYFLSLFSRS
ncbi:hypothetical protein BKA64DRAFT_388079 [Cadophora sp. MPI-SDFR-AT-0126]|nr:hypothetical protein BKA64DRAFT_388079 [Leotiomycetes sp. MPI-SDFR-AT-0126]